MPTINNDDPLTTVCENFAELILDNKTFLGDLNIVDGLNLQDNLDAFIERKLFTLNTGHAITAYLGIENNISTIGEAIKEPQIYSIVKEAMQESGEVLIRRYNFVKEQHYAYINKILSRFKNPFFE